MLKLPIGQQIDYTNPLLYHLDIGEIGNFLTSTGIDKLEYAYSYLWPEDMCTALILCIIGQNGKQGWLCDLMNKLTKLDERKLVSASWEMTH